MAEAQRKLQYYLENPDEMPDDPAEIERLTNEHLAGAIELGESALTVERFVAPEDAPKDDKVAAPSDGVKAEEPKEPTVEVKAEAETKPDGVLAKDGKNVIPYSQLESARNRATAAEQISAQRAEQIAALEAQIAAGVKPADVKVDEVQILSEDELAALEADSPTLAKVLRSQQTYMQATAKQMAELKGTVTQLNNRAEREAATEQDTVKSEVQLAIDANPMLAEWQTAEDQTMWERASALDKTIRAMPEYANKSFAERFEKVVQMTQAAFDVAPAREPAAQPSAAEVKAAAKARLDAANKKAVPKSLSDIPGGAPPAVDERGRVEEMSVAEIGNKFLGMKSADEINAFISSL